MPAILSLKNKPLISLAPLKKLPEKLIYHKKITYNNGIKEDYAVIFSLKDPSKSAYAYFYEDTVYRYDMGRVKSMYVAALSAEKNPNEGFGTALLKFIINKSKTKNTNGRIHLYASSNSNPDRVPHIFYKKFGMNTGNPLIDRKLDRYIAKRRDATSNDFTLQEFFYPQIGYKTKSKTFWTRFLIVIRNFFCSNYDF